LKKGKPEIQTEPTNIPFISDYKEKHTEIVPVVIEKLDEKLQEKIKLENIGDLLEYADARLADSAVIVKHHIESISNNDEDLQVIVETIW